MHDRERGEGSKTLHTSPSCDKLVPGSSWIASLVSLISFGAFLFLHRAMFMFAPYSLLMGGKVLFFHLLSPPLLPHTTTRDKFQHHTNPMQENCPLYSLLCKPTTEPTLSCGSWFTSSRIFLLDCVPCMSILQGNWKGKEEGSGKNFMRYQGFSWTEQGSKRNTSVSKIKSGLDHAKNMHFSLLPFHLHLNPHLFSKRQTSFSKQALPFLSPKNSVSSSCIGRHLTLDMNLSSSFKLTAFAIAFLALSSLATTMAAPAPYSCYDPSFACNDNIPPHQSY